MSTATRVTFIVGILLLSYGYLCRLFSIYFFWDSKYFGWLGIISGLLLLLIDLRIKRVRQNENIFFVRVFVAVIVIFLAIEASAVVWLKTSTAYGNLTASINTDDALKAEIGDIRGYGLIPGIDILNIITALESESLIFRITVRGERAYKELEVTIERISPLEWRVSSIQPI